MLYTPIKFRNLEIANRWTMSPMCMYSADNGMATHFHLVHYGSRAQGGAGLIMTEATGVEPQGRISPYCLGIWNDEQAEALAAIVQFVHENSASKIGIQLAHAGRKGSVWNNRQLSPEEGWQTVAPSPLPYKPGDFPPHELSIDEIKKITNQFQDAAQRAVSAGFDVIELHAAHGYLIHQFLSPLSNTRADEYGGSFENRIRFLLEITEAVNEVLDENHPLFVRISGTEYAEGGWEVEDSIALAKILKDQNVDLIDVSSGGNIHGAKITAFDSYQVPFSAAVRKNANIKTGAVGLIKTAEQAQGILDDGDADLIFVARELLRNPYLPVQSAFQLQKNCFFPHQYERAKP